MDSAEVLIWKDITSETIGNKEYIKKFYGKKKIKEIYDDYLPNKEILNEIKRILEKKKDKMKVLAIGATWCPDCSLEVTRMIKISEFLSDLIEFCILYGVKVDPYAKMKKKKIGWSKKHSPQEATNPKFNLTKIPGFFIFNDNGDLIGKFIEHPEKTPTIEEELLYYLKKEN